MKKRVIQVYLASKESISPDTCYPKNFIGFVCSTRKRYRINQIALITYREGTILNTPKKYFIGKCVQKDKHQYTFEVLNNGL
jgi:hypothetical protein